MGKSALLLNYYVRHIRAILRPYKLILLPLSRDLVPLLEHIDKSARSITVLLLDGLDEDPQAVHDPPAKLMQMVNVTAEFRSVVITCRTQFFTKDADIPSLTPVITDVRRIW